MIGVLYQTNNLRKREDSFRRDVDETNFIGVIIENLLFLALLAIFHVGAVLPEDFLQSVIAQSLWAAFTGPFVVFIFDYFHIRLGNWLDEWTLSRRENR